MPDHGTVENQVHDAAAHGEAVVHDAHGAAGELAHGVGEQALHHGRSISHPPEMPNFIQMAFEAKHGHDYGDPANGEELSFLQVLHGGPLAKPVPFFDYAPWENNVFALIGALALCGLAVVATRPFRTRSKHDQLRNPTRLQIFVENLVSATLGFCQGILGEANGRKYMPYVSGLFFFILTLNLMGIVPFMKAPTSSILITGSLAATTFFVYAYIGLTRLGPVELFKHLCGSPAGLIQWLLSPLMFVIECISFFIAKPLSLALRLFGNILGKDILLGVMMMLGFLISTSLFKGLGGYVGVPLTFPFYFLALLLSTIQALVFAMLSAIYILMCLPHDHDHEDDHGHGEAHAHH